MSRIDGRSEALQQLRAELEPIHRDFYRLDALTLRRGLRLPRVAVVGELSSGKSSVLEAFTHIDFRTSERHGTLFATALILRSASVAKADAKVTTGDKTAESGTKIQSLQRKGADERDLAGIIQDAKSILMIKHTGVSYPQHGLYVKLSGPDLFPLFITDLPGIRWQAGYQEDALLCQELAEREMLNPDVTILAVIPAQHSLNAFKILDMVRRYDPSGERTLGIITKPDMAVSQAEQIKFAKVATNLDPAYKLGLGWHILRNRSPSEWDISSSERDYNESEFFRSPPWSSIPAQARGAWMLRIRLSQVLQGSIMKSFPELSKATENKLEAIEARLTRLGPPLCSVDEARSYMLKAAAQFQILAVAAIRGDYSDGFFGELTFGSESCLSEDTRARKLRTLMRDLNSAFALVLLTKGARRRITGLHENEPQIPTYLQPLVSFYHQDDPVYTPREDFVSKTEHLLSSNTTGPGSSVEALVTNLFREQSSSWESIATTHFELAKSSVKEFVKAALTYIVGTENRALVEVFKTFVDPFFDRKSEELEAKLKELLKHYNEGHLQPHDLDFRRILFQGQRLPDQNVVPMTGQETWSIARSNAEAAVTEMTTYYNYSLQTFTENVIILGVENCLVSQVPEILSLDRVLELSDERLALLAKEPVQTTQRRTALQLERSELRTAFRACQRHQNRGLPGIPIALREMKLTEGMMGVPAQIPTTVGVTELFEVA
ncbi:P-loop containing nucleoside triphosphate hydrolase protein [Dactylonectria estremocensis]|uniref:P-loop containing nucleoside triphosphate hydrolase protein n=1 Tax=Dactylonectria estremocensis TaxID=1079267 RepID=A0A9P9FJ24_9HYPO|nr:P-loop containing nucleoside triphosphate hydrolase protein [Dactylonectria estremocensis]